ncbi:MAG: coproporphyrinogen-III oxidase family protein [Candidatus Omnitrophica bacterium]|nr:coproporphyrinogen-III oxidase family protein [Candidatus Omnitrophota bacterium]MDD5552833.1 coproporphyrinogen-III oxidase family protein [Candidatus Omnitrophota bacterium]
MKSWRGYIKEELNKDPGILLLAYPYTFLWSHVNEGEARGAWHKHSHEPEKIVYIHIPFCERKCFFCDFTAYFSQPYSLIKKYIGSLKKEMKLASSFTRRFLTNYLSIGGGTPSILREAELAGVLKTARDTMDFKSGAVMSVEIFPDGSINDSKLRLLKDHGVNRISLGIQSFDDKVKKRCNRFDTLDQDVHIYNRARKTGFDNINLDLMFGLPGQSLGSWRKTLSLTVQLGPEHICICPLTARRAEIPFYEYMRTVDIKNMRRIFHFTRDFLDAKGYSQVSRHSYVKKRSIDIYNDFFSMLTPVLGLGLNSLSYNSDLTYKNTAELKKYFSYLDKGRLPVEKGFRLRGKYLMGNYIVRSMGHFTLDRRDFKERFGKDITYYFRRAVQVLKEFKLIEIDKNSVNLTPKGIFYEALVKRCFYSLKILRDKEAFRKEIIIQKSNEDRP